jgi:hypothetical protein
MKINVVLRISGELASIRGEQPFAIQGADRSMTHQGFVLVDRNRVNCVRFDRDKVPVIFSEASTIRVLADDLNRR